MGVEAAVLTDALLRLQHLGAHVRLAGAQLELILAPVGQREWIRCFMICMIVQKGSEQID